MGITNAPQGGGSSGGGEWTLVNITNWNDIFDSSSGIITCKKDTLITGNFPGYGSGWDGAVNILIPKGMSGATLIFPFTAVGITGTKLYVGTQMQFSSSMLGNKLFKVYYAEINGFGSNLAINNNVSSSPTASYVKIFTRD